MNGSLGLAAMCVGVSMASIGWACPAPVQPNADSSYETIVLAEVVGVHLTDYTPERLQQIKEGRLYAWPSDTSPGYDVDLIAFETFKGTTEKTLSLHVAAGCGVPTPDLNQFGIFYVNETGQARVVLQAHSDYRDRLQKLGSRYAATCLPAERFSTHPCWKPSLARLECLSLVKDLAFITPLSCPIGVQELYEQMKAVTVKQYGWQWPPLKLPGGAVGGFVDEEKPPGSR
jgi:hypothetical protein